MPVPRRECEWCGALATWEIVAAWHSFWSCSKHDVAMVDDCVSHGVIIYEINELMEGPGS